MKYLAEGQLITKTAEASQALMKEVFPGEFIARNVGHVINFGNTGTPALATPTPAKGTSTCNDYVSLVSTDTTLNN